MICQRRASMGHRCCFRQHYATTWRKGAAPIALEECTGDRVPGAVAWNLFHIDAKFADVETVEMCLTYLVILTK
jgi:maleamate amidohydrolase